jgi:hypothetical protein
MTLKTICQLIQGNIEPADAPDMDWDTIVAEARRQGVAPLIYWRLAQDGQLKNIPEAAQNALREAYATTWMNNQRILSELSTLARLFQQADIPAVVLKGACFVLTLYPDIGLRPMSDLDIMVPKARVTEAVQIAAGLGYLDAAPEAVPGMNARVNHHVWLQKPDAPAHLLEIHYSLVADQGFTFAVPVDWFWEQAQPIEAKLQQEYPALLMLSAEAQILYAAAHATLQHGFKETPLRWFYDFDRLARRYSHQIDWQALIEQAQHLEWGSALGAYAAETVKYFETPIPINIQETLAGLSDRHSHLVQSQKQAAATQTLSELQAIAKLQGVEKLSKLIALLTPTPAYMRWRYGLEKNWQLPAAYLRRWAGIAQDGLRTLAALLKR